MKRNFKAAMFDFDGTITVPGVYSPTQEMVDALVGLAQKVPIGFCTGRQLESFEHRGLNSLMAEIDPAERDAFLRNLFLFAENGAVGYAFNVGRGEFEEFYKVKWPERFVAKEKLKLKVAEAVKEYGDIYENAHKIVIVIRTNLHDVEDRRIEDVYALSASIYEVCVKLLGGIDADFGRFLHVGNSGIGVIIGPANGDKDEAVKQFGGFLEEQRGMKFDRRFREILVVGDSPQVGGNDHYFLNGRFGMAYSVGEAGVGEFPIETVDVSGKRLFNDKGTLYLINSLFG